MAYSAVAESLPVLSRPEDVVKTPYMLPAASTSRYRDQWSGDHGRLAFDTAISRHDANINHDMSDFLNSVKYTQESVLLSEIKSSHLRAVELREADLAAAAEAQRAEAARLELLAARAKARAHMLDRDSDSDDNDLDAVTRSAVKTTAKRNVGVSKATTSAKTSKRRGPQGVTAAMRENAAKRARLTSQASSGTRKSALLLSSSSSDENDDRT
jgi:hypothetical protein